MDVWTGIYMTRFTNWKAIEKEFILQHVVKTPSDDSCICKKYMQMSLSHTRLYPKMERKAFNGYILLD